MAKVVPENRGHGSIPVTQNSGKDCSHGARSQLQVVATDNNNNTDACGVASGDGSGYVQEGLVLNSDKSSKGLAKIGGVACGTKKSCASFVAREGKLDKKNSSYSSRGSSRPSSGAEEEEGRDRLSEYTSGLEDDEEVEKDTVPLPWKEFSCKTITGWLVRTLNEQFLTFWKASWVAVLAGTFYVLVYYFTVFLYRFILDLTGEVVRQQGLDLLILLMAQIISLLPLPILYNGALFNHIFVNMTSVLSMAAIGALVYVARDGYLDLHPFWVFVAGTTCGSCFYATIRLKTMCSMRWRRKVFRFITWGCGLMCISILSSFYIVVSNYVQDQFWVELGLLGLVYPSFQFLARKAGERSFSFYLTKVKNDRRAVLGGIHLMTEIILSTPGFFALFKSNSNVTFFVSIGTSIALETFGVIAFIKWNILLNDMSTTTRGGKLKNLSVMRYNRKVLGAIISFQELGEKTALLLAAFLATFWFSPEDNMIHRFPIAVALEAMSDILKNSIAASLKVDTSNQSVHYSLKYVLATSFPSSVGLVSVGIGHILIFFFEMK